ncbi:MAG: hypothetical protein KAR79_00010 [Simkaniaceae bacterium]|nr:hypothetical protein [Simkaniaceae bacterium]
MCHIWKVWQEQIDLQIKESAQTILENICNYSDEDVKNLRNLKSKSEEIIHELEGKLNVIVNRNYILEYINSTNSRSLKYQFSQYDIFDHYDPITIYEILESEIEENKLEKFSRAIQAYANAELNDDPTKYRKCANLCLNIPDNEIKMSALSMIIETLCKKSVRYAEFCESLVKEIKSDMKSSASYKQKKNSFHYIFFTYLNANQFNNAERVLKQMFSELELIRPGTKDGYKKQLQQKRDAYNAKEAVNHFALPKYPLVLGSIFILLRRRRT